MEGFSHVLAHKTDKHLFIKLYHTKPKGNPRWEYVEDLRLATTFTGHQEAEERQRAHKVPPLAAMPREYVAAHADWLRALEFPPEKRERQERFNLG